MSKLQLPIGSKHGLAIIDKLSTYQVEEISLKILNSLPITQVDNLFPELILNRISNEASISKAELTIAITTLIALWKQASFQTMKVEIFKGELSKLALNEATMETLASLWRLQADATLNRLRNISHSGVPELQNIHWSILLERADCYQPQKKELRALLQLQTNQGNKYTKMTFEELQKLHYTLQTVQKKMDSITKR